VNFIVGVRPLFIAVKGKNSAAIIRILLDAHADVNIADHNGNTPLHIVSEKGSYLSSV
jgi:ankyrin repeat protein